jgi:dienelactone hydrolase
MIVSAVSLWKKFNLTTPLGASEWGIEDKDGKRSSHVSYFGHAVEDGSVRIYARFMRPISSQKTPVVLLLNDKGKSADDELMRYFLDKGYAVLCPDYSGKMETDEEGTFRTIYPNSLEYGNLEKARGLKETEGYGVDETTWFEWTYVALYSIEYLKSRHDVGAIGVVGVRTGGDIAWQTLLSPDVKCGVPINAVGWKSFSDIAKFSNSVAHNLSDNQHRFIAAVEAQSYAPYVKSPVLMLCSLRDGRFDCDRAYDTFSRIGGDDGNALVYSVDSGACIGPNALNDMDLFLERNLKGREIYIPDTLNVILKETQEGLNVEVESDKEGILQELGVFYAEADVKTKCAYRDWRRVYKADGKSVVGGKAAFSIKPFEGATAAFAYAYAKYINGFTVVSKITCKRLSNPNFSAVKGRMLFSGSEMEAFGVAMYDEYSIGDIFLERDALPKTALGYGNVKGAFSVGGIKTYKISSPMYVPDENALLEFDVYGKTDFELKVTIDRGDMEHDFEQYTHVLDVKGGGKWKRIILKAADFKGENSGMPLRNFYEGSALTFDCDDERAEYAITNILWL